MSKKSEQDETTKHLFWMLLRELEEKCGNSAGPLDADLIRASYRHYSKLEGREILPAYISSDVRERQLGPVSAQTVFAPGERLRHPIFGDGTVVCHKTGNLGVVVIDFDAPVGGKEMVFSFCYPKLSRI